MPEHGEIYRKRLSIGGWTYSKTIRFCAFHGEIDLVTCDDWEARHDGCARKAREISQAETIDFERAARSIVQPVAGNMEIFWQHGL